MELMLKQLNENSKMNDELKNSRMSGEDKKICTLALACTYSTVSA